MKYRMKDTALDIFYCGIPLVVCLIQVDLWFIDEVLDYGNQVDLESEDEICEEEEEEKVLLTFTYSFLTLSLEEYIWNGTAHVL